MTYTVNQEVMIWQTFEIEAESNEEAIRLAKSLDCEPLGAIERDDNSEQIIHTEVLTEDGETIYTDFLTMKPKHTPGPWTAVKLSEGWAIKQKELPAGFSDRIAELREYPQMEANARLIAHSPEMFDLLTKIEAILSGPYERTTIDSERQKRTARIQRMIGDLLSKIEGI